MKYTPPHRIQWHEGMLLGPQHFQQESARVDDLVAWHHLAADPFAWGLRRLEIDERLLANGLVRVRHLEAVMPDGMGVIWSVDDSHGQDLELDLAAHAAELEQGELPVYLTIGRTRSLREAGGSARFRGVQAEPVEDEVSSALPVEIPRAVPNLALSAGRVPSSMFLHMQLMAVRKDNEIFKRGPFVAALLDVGQDSAIHRRAMELASQMRSKAAFLARQAGDLSSGLEARLAILEHRLRLASLVQALPVLEALLRAPALHPYALYLALCAQLGPLATLRPGAVPLLPAPWQHADPMACLGPVFDAVQDLLGEVSHEWRTRPMAFEDGAFCLDMQPAWMAPRLVVGLRGQPERELAAWMAGAVIASRPVWTLLSDRRVLGAPRRRIEEAPEMGLRSGAGYTLFSIEVDERLVAGDQTLVIRNVNETSALQRPHEMVLFIKG